MDDREAEVDRGKSSDPRRMWRAAAENKGEEMN